MRHMLARIVVVLVSIMFVIAIVSLPGTKLMARLLAAEAADAGSFLPAIFNNASGGVPPQPSPSLTPTLPPGTTATYTPQATMTATEAATRPPKSTATPSPTVIGTYTPSPTFTVTPVSSNTPMGIYSPTPGINPVTATPTASSTPQMSQAIVLPNVSTYVDQGHDLHMVGEVKNTGASLIQFVSIKAVFYSRSGVELDDATTYAKLTILPPGEKTCFQFLLPEPVGFSRYEITEVKHLPGVDAPLPLSFSNVQINFNAANGFYSLAGKVTNNGDTLLLDPTAIGTLYDADGIVRGCQEVPLGVNEPRLTLPAGSGAPFQMSFTGRNNSDVTSYRLQADGRYPDEE